MRPSLFKETIEERFERFHRDNQKVWHLFDRFTRAAINAGKKRIGSKAVIERIRWECIVSTTGAEFKINNDFTPLYARRWMELNPAHGDIFQTRERRSV